MIPRYSFRLINKIFLQCTDHNKKKKKKLIMKCFTVKESVWKLSSHDDEKEKKIQQKYYLIKHFGI